MNRAAQGPAAICYSARAFCRPQKAICRPQKPTLAAFLPTKTAFLPTEKPKTLSFIGFLPTETATEAGRGAINLYQEPAWRPLPNRIEISAKFKRGRPEILKPLQSSAALDAEKGRTWAAIHATAPLKMQDDRDNLPKSAQIGKLLKSEPAAAAHRQPAQNAQKNGGYTDG